MSIDFRKFNLVVVIPAYNVADTIGPVLEGLPDYLRHIIVVDDASPDNTPALIQASAQRDQRIVLVCHESNEGVGGATVTGFRKALELGAQVVIKIDGDNQMDPAYIPTLVTPLLEGKADYVKGNRFRDFESLQRMPLARRIGNLGLSFLTKAATGYWNCFDPTNGFFAIRAEILAQLPLERIDRRYFFETAMLANLYLLDAFILDVPMPARYRGERSSMSIWRVLAEFPAKLLTILLRRLMLRYFLFDFSMVSVYLLTGIPLILFGLIFGSLKWIQYLQLGVPAPTGTVILPTLAIILGIQILLSAIELDMNAAPKSSRSGPLI
jgi:glycosyltransferase involved in cell wall biosynthesis